MEFRTVVDIAKAPFEIAPFEEMLFVGSCFADSIGRRFVEEKFLATVNPRGTMYNPASICHTVMAVEAAPHVAVFTLGTNHVYRLKATGEIVDNCQKRPQSLFNEEELSVEECADYLLKAISELQRRNPQVRVILTVSPIRYRKYGYHGSQLSKATLLLAADSVVSRLPEVVSYFPAYEIVCDELRDYRFYQPDMLHPSDQAVEYIWQRFSATYFSQAALDFMEEWRPVKEALAHKPFNPDAPAYQEFLSKTMLKVEQLKQKYPKFAL